MVSHLHLVSHVMSTLTTFHAAPGDPSPQPPGTGPAGTTATITTKATNIGTDILAATAALAIVAAFFTTAQRRLVVVGSIVLLGAFAMMIVGHPADTLTTLGGGIKSAVWDPIIGSLTN